MAFYKREIVWAKDGVAVLCESLRCGNVAFTVILFDSERARGSLGKVQIACKSEAQALSLAESLSMAIAVTISEN